MNSCRKKLFFSISIVLSLFFSPQVKAQFTYIGVGTSYDFLPISSGYSGTENHHQLNVGIDFLFRPLQKLGFGIELTQPIVQSKHLNFPNAETNPSWVEFNGFEGEYTPEEFHYKINFTTSTTVTAVYFLEPFANSYIKAGMKFGAIEESFLYVSDSLRFREITIDNRTNQNYAIPVLGIGIQPQFDNGVYIKMGVDASLFSFGNASFSYNFKYKKDIADHVYSVNLRSHLRRTKVRFNFGFTVGLYL